MESKTYLKDSDSCSSSISYLMVNITAAINAAGAVVVEKKEKAWQLE
jgi:hypothetical protein